jgi:hypothetical protein
MSSLLKFIQLYSIGTFSQKLHLMGGENVVLKGITGKIKHLRVGDLVGWGSGSDVINTEVVVVFDTAPTQAFGFYLKANDPNLPSRLGMLSLLRDAYVHKLTIGCAYEIDPGKKNGILRRVDLAQ